MQKVRDLVRDLVRNAETSYTVSMYSVSGTLAQRIGGTAAVTEAASITTKVSHSLYASLRIDLSGLAGSAAISELGGAAVHWRQRRARRS